MSSGGPTRTVVVTGYGIVTPYGSGIDCAWQALHDGISAGAAWSPGSNAQEMFAAAPDDYHPHPDIPRNLVHFLDNGALYAVDASLQALASAGLQAGAGDARRFGLVDGAAYRAPGQPTLFVPYGQTVARVLGVRGPVLSVGGAEASGMAAIAEAARLIATNEADVVVAGASQALQPPLCDHIREQGWTSGEPALPFDAAHAGLVPGEAAASIVLEAEEHANGRGARYVARIASTGTVFDALAEPLAPPDAADAGRAMQAALANAGYLQNQVDLLVSCADGRPAYDAADSTGAMRTFGRHAFFAGVTTAAASLGATFAASGPLSMVAALEAMRRQEVFPVAGLRNPAPGVDLAFVREARAERLDCVLVSSVGTGGTAVAVLLQR